MSEERIDVYDGKYTVVLGSKGELSALRYGEPWQDLTGNNLVYWLAVELRNAREALAGQSAETRRLAGIVDEVSTWAVGALAGDIARARAMDKIEHIAKITAPQEQP